MMKSTSITGKESVSRRRRRRRAQHVEVSFTAKNALNFEGTRADVNEIEIVIGNNMINGSIGG